MYKYRPTTPKKADIVWDNGANSSIYFAVSSGWTLTIVKLNWPSRI